MLLIPAQGVAQKALVGPGLAAELLLEEEVQMDSPQLVLPRRLGLEQEEGSGIGVDSNHDLVGLRRRLVAADADRGRALQDHADLSGLRRHLLAVPQKKGDA